MGGSRRGNLKGKAGAVSQQGRSAGIVQSSCAGGAMSEPLKLAPTEERFLDMLNDGQRHTKQELHGLLWDEQSNMRTVSCWIVRLRRKLRPLGRDIVCELHYGKIHYRQVRLLASPNDGRK